MPTVGGNTDTRATYRLEHIFTNGLSFRRGDAFWLARSRRVADKPKHSPV